MAGFYSCLKSSHDCMMAAKTTDPTEPLEAEDAGEEFSRKKKSRFQSFKNFFAKKKKGRAAAPPSPGEAKLKPSQSSSDLAAPAPGPGLLRLPAEPAPKGSMGSKALSHDSIFISESSPDVADKAASQEDLPGKGKALQLRLQPNLRRGSAALVIPGQEVEDAGAVSEDDGLPRSPPEISSLRDALACSTSESSNPFQRHSSLSLDSEDEQVTSDSASRPLSPVSPAVSGNPASSPTGRFAPADFNSPATPLGCLDTSAARHKMAVNPRRQKAFANRSLLMEQLEKEERSFGTAEGKSSPPESPEGADSQGKDWKGLSAQNAKICSWTHNILPVTRVADALRYSWNAGPGAEGDWRLGLENHGEAGKETAVHSDSRPHELPKRGDKEDAEEEGVEKTEGLKPSPAKEVVERSGSLQPEAEAAGLGDLPLSALHGDVAGRDHSLPAEYIRASCPQLEGQDSKDSRTGHDAKYGDRAEGRTRSGDGSLSPASDSGEFVPSLVSEVLSAAEEEAVVSACEAAPAAQEGAGGGSVDVESGPFGGHTQPAASQQEEGVVTLGAEIEEPPLQKAPCGNLSPSPDPCTSPLRNSPGRQEGSRIPRSGGFPSLPPEVAEMSSKSVPLDSDAREPLGNVKTGEERQNPGEDVETQAKCLPGKPVRFTIAPAWQRSLSGGSSPMDSAGPASSPSSPIKAELFEGMPQPDASALPGELFQSPERLDRSKRSTNPATEGPSEDLQGQGSPFGVKLRRTSSLLKYQAEQQPQLLTKQTPPASSVVAKDEPKVPEASLPKRTGGTKGLAAKSGFREEKKPLKAKVEEGTAKPPISRAPEQSPAAAPETPSPEPAWISMAKLKRRGFQGFQKRDETPLAKAEPEEEEEEAHAGISRQEKHLDPTGQPLMKNSSLHHVLQAKAQPKMTTSTPKAKPLQGAPQAAAEVLSLPSLPLSASCSPSEPPWLSLAKKKAKAWSEMPQIVQ